MGHRKLLLERKGLFLIGEIAERSNAYPYYFFRKQIVVRISDKEKKN
jgi:hypothetical protein